VPPAGRGEIERLLKELGSEAAEQRWRATKRLIQLDGEARPQVEAALAAPDAEVRRRAKQILAAAERPDPLPLRAVECLELIGSAEARKVLKTIADGAAGARLTKDAAAALQGRGAGQ